MITFTVFRNGELVCRAGAEHLGVLTTIVTWALRESTKHPDGEELDMTVGGLISSGPEKGTHLDWARLDVRRGDEITVRIGESDAADSPMEKRPGEAVTEMITSHEQDYVRRMCTKWGWTINERP